MSLNNAADVDVLCIPDTMEVIAGTSSGIWSAKSKGGTYDIRLVQSAYWRRPRRSKCWRYQYEEGVVNVRPKEWPDA
jgi:hypothetical protein